MQNSAVEKLAKSTVAVETGFLVAGVTVSLVAAIQAVVTVAGWMGVLVAG